MLFFYKQLLCYLSFSIVSSKLFKNWIWLRGNIERNHEKSVVEHDRLHEIQNTLFQGIESLSYLLHNARTWVQIPSNQVQVGCPCSYFTHLQPRNMSYRIKKAPRAYRQDILIKGRMLVSVTEFYLKNRWWGGEPEKTNVNV